MPGPSERAGSGGSTSGTWDPGTSTFVDTNIWVYAHLKAPDDPRHKQAQTLLSRDASFVISPQVVAEYYNVMLRNKQADDWIQSNLRAMFTLTRLQPANANVVSNALHLRARYGFSFWDCQIAAAAIEAGCTCVLTEDLRHGQVVDKVLRVINPFK
jgi:predicted nucleic acid-binding protein